MKNIHLAGTMGLVLLLTLGASPLRAETNSLAETSAGDKWHFFSIPHLWAAGMKGEVAIKGISADVDIGFDTIKDHLQGGFMTYMELRREKFGFFLNPMYLNLAADGSISDGGDADFEQTLWVVELGGFYNLGTWGEKRQLTLDALGGVRYWNNKIDLDVSGPLIGSRSLSTRDDLTDLFVGLRANQRLTERLSLSLRGDLGGFSLIGDSSQFSWQAMGLLGYDLGKHFTLWGGYRALSVDNQPGTIDLTLHGPIVGLEIRF